MTFREWRNHCADTLEPILGKRETQSVFRIWMQERLPAPFWDWLISPERLIPAPILSVITDELQLLAQDYPVQYLTQCCYFMDSPWLVGPDVLIPRQETEELVLWALELLEKDSKSSVLDICTGSGCIPIMLQRERKNIQVMALDISAKALDYAHKNQEKYKTTIQFIEQDWFSFQPQQTWDLITSNPPYIPLSECQQLSKSVREYEPLLALEVPDENPLLFYHSIIQKGRLMLRTGGAILMEIHENFGEAIQKFAETEGAQVEIKKDSFGKDRMIKIFWKNNPEVLGLE